MRITEADALALFRQVHGDSYSYEKFVWPGRQGHALATCSQHGDFRVIPVTHASGVGCDGCNQRVLDEGYAERLITRLHNFHGEAYSVSREDLLARKSKVRFSCLVHGEFKAYPANVIRRDSKPCTLCASISE